MKLSSELRKAYVPKFAGNLDLDSSEQVVVEWDVLSAGRIRSIKPKRDVRHNYDAKGQYVGMELHYDNDDFAVINGFNPKIKNFTYADRDGKERKITNCETLFEAPSTVSGKLIKELADEFRKELREAEETDDDEKK